MSGNVIDVQTLLDNDFERSATEIKTLINLDNTILLELYGYYKQATVGNNVASQPSFLDFKGQLKWDVWNCHKGMLKQTAQVKYIKLVAKLTDNKKR